MNHPQTPNEVAEHLAKISRPTFEQVAISRLAMAEYEARHGHPFVPRYKVISSLVHRACFILGAWHRHQQKGGLVV